MILTNEEIIIFTTLFILTISTITGILSSLLQSKKGYDGGFWIGFLLGIIGLIYSAGLPDISKKKISKQGKVQIIETSDDEFEENNYVLCKKCGFPIYEDENKCSNCGESKTYRNK